MWPSLGMIPELQPGESGVILQEVPLQSGPDHRALLRGELSGYTIQVRSFWSGKHDDDRQLAIHPFLQDYLDNLKDESDA